MRWTSCLVAVAASCAMVAGPTYAAAAAPPEPVPPASVKSAGGVGTLDVCNYTTSRPTIRQGSTGAAVRQAQCYLNLSLSSDTSAPLVIDGDFGPKTNAATRKFQTCARITVDGIIGPQTWGQLQYWANSPTWVPCRTAGQTITTLSWNMCGTDDHCSYNNQPGVKDDAIIRSINSHSADVVLLQEACTSHQQDLQSKLGSGWTVLFGYVRQNGANKSCVNAGGWFGVILAVRGRVTNWWTVQLTSPAGREQRIAVCARQAWRGIQACSAHFSSQRDDPDLSFRAQQANELAAVNRDGASFSYSSIVGGDLNWDPPDRNGTPYATPARQPTLVPLYVSNWECDEPEYRSRDGADTFPEPFPFDDHKYDYVFGSAGGFSSFRGDVTGSSYSDHNLLTATFVVS